MRLLSTLAALLMFAAQSRSQDAVTDPAALVLGKPISVHFLQAEAVVDAESEHPMPYGTRVYRVKLRVDRIVAGSLKPPRVVSIELREIPGLYQIAKQKQIYVALKLSNGRIEAFSREAWSVPYQIACFRPKDIVGTELQRKFTELETNLGARCAWL